MKRSDQIARAERLRALHHGPRILVLPNVWDPLGARMIASLGFPAVATASAAVAWSRGVDDGEKLSFDAMLDAIGGIAEAVSVPVTADIEGGYATAPDDLAANVRRVITAGAVGVNIEDSFGEGRAFHDVAAQCERLSAARAAADAEGVPLVINARTDVFLDPRERTRDGRIAEAIARGRAYLEAGADCVYPIGPADAATARALREGLDAPINLFLSANAAPLAELEAIGIARVSTGPGLLKAAMAGMRSAAQDLLAGRGYARFTTDAVTSAEILEWLKETANR